MGEEFIDFIIWAPLAFMGMLAVRLILEAFLNQLDNITMNDITVVASNITPMFGENNE